MQTVSTGRHRTLRERVCVLYDRGSGVIRHIQHVIVMEGGHNPGEREIEAMCRSALDKRGEPHHGLDTLHLERSALQPFKRCRVDPKNKKLEELKPDDRG